MRLFTIEHSTFAYGADFVLYTAATLGLAALLVFGSPRPSLPANLLLVAGGLVAWTLIEYVLHRFVLHGLRPFSTWHAEHHQRPTALICAPTVLSGSLIFGLVFVPAWWLAGPWHACALTLGVLAGYLGYAITHHAVHHWRTENAWLKQCKRRHALHHNPKGPHGHYGVTSALWDRVARLSS